MAKPISVVFVLTLIILLPAGLCAAGRPVECCQGRTLTVTLTVDAPGQTRLILAADDKMPGESQANPKTEDRAAEVPDQKKDPSKTTTKPLKPFVPSEKVKAGQVVDFPYDI